MKENMCYIHIISLVYKILNAIIVWLGKRNTSNWKIDNLIFIEDEAKSWSLSTRLGSR